MRKCCLAGLVTVIALAGTGCGVSDAAMEGDFHAGESADVWESSVEVAWESIAGVSESAGGAGSAGAALKDAEGPEGSGAAGENGAVGENGTAGEKEAGMPGKDTAAGNAEDGMEELHGPAESAAVIDNPVSGYCGNTITVVKVGTEEFSFWGSDSVTLTDILINLAYEEGRTCRCPTEYTVDTEFGEGYGVNLTECFVRYEGSQAALTAEQADIIEDIISRLTQKP